MMYDMLYESCIWHSRVALFDPEGRLVSVHYDDVLRPFLDDAVVLGRVRSFSFCNSVLCAMFCAGGIIGLGF